MGETATIKLVEGSTQQAITLEEVKALLERYIEQTTKTGRQLGWNYQEHAFPYTIETRPEAEGKWFLLRGKQPGYRAIVIGVETEPYTVTTERPKEGTNGETETVTETRQSAYIAVHLPDVSTHGDKAKANEFCKYLAKTLQAELHLFNGRVMYYNPRKG